MAFVVNSFERTAGDRTGSVVELADTTGSIRAEIWAAVGFNCLRWQVRQPDGTWGDLLFVAPDWETNPVPTRSGHPILFPFPGRLRDGRLTFQSKTYQLPCTESSGKNAIHGFTPRNRWRVIDSGTDDDFAFATGQFTLSKDLPAERDYWPADFTLNVTYRLYADRLRVDAQVENRGPGPLPFGLGYHPYFHLPGLAETDVSGYQLTAHADQVWATDADNLPTGWRNDLPPELDFQNPRPIGATQLDHVLTNVTAKPTGLVDLVELATIAHPEAGRIRVRADAAFRELVLFTPPHRRAVAVEPYTCSADAANLFERGIDSGWRVLEPGGEWEARVEYRWEPASG